MKFILLRMKRGVLLCAMGTQLVAAEAPALFTHSGSDPSFKSLLDDGKVIAGKNTTTGVKGSKIDVNNKLVEKGTNAKNPIPKDIAIHTLCNSVSERISAQDRREEKKVVFHKVMIAFES
jgi:hypothetical protein